MLVQQFPDINWLKDKIKQNFSDKKALNNVILDHSGWPTIILNTKTSFTDRRDIKGPFSLFLNKSGSSSVNIEGKTAKLNNQCFTFSNFNQSYDLLIDEKVETETLNIHFGEHFFFQALTSLALTQEQLLDLGNGELDCQLNIRPRTLLRDDTFNHLISRLYHSYEVGEDKLKKEEDLFQLLQYILTINSKELWRIRSLQVKKSSTKYELVDRLNHARDFIHFNFTQDISLDELSQVSCLSKFHFLRVFKEVFNQTPYQYIKVLRFQKAMDLIKNSRLSLEEIALEIGLENASSLSRFVFQQTSQYPSSFRD